LTTDQGPSEREGYYLYGIVPAGAPGSFGPIGVRGGEEVFAIPWKDLAAVVSRHPVRVPTPEPEKLMAHARALEEIMKRTTVIPVKFGVVFDSQRTLLRLLQQNATELKEILAMVAGRIELGLKVAWRKETLQEIFAEMASSDPEVMAWKQEAEKTNGNGLQIALSLGELVQNKLAKKAEELRAELLAPLQRLAVATRRNETRMERMILNEAFLVDRDREAEFDRAVEELVAEYEDRLEFKYTGPWPPYSFAILKVERVD